MSLPPSVTRISSSVMPARVESARSMSVPPGSETRQPMVARVSRSHFEICDV
jgi:hypothetical protein